MGEKKLIAILDSLTGDPKQKPIMKPFEGAEKDKWLKTTFEEFLEKMCKDEGFTDYQKGIATYCSNLLEETKRNQYAEDKNHILITVFEPDGKTPKPRLDENGNAQGSKIKVKDIVGKYIDERERQDTKYDCIDMRVSPSLPVGDK